MSPTLKGRSLMGFQSAERTCKSLPQGCSGHPGANQLSSRALLGQGGVASFTLGSFLLLTSCKGVCHPLVPLHHLPPVAGQRGEIKRYTEMKLQPSLVVFSYRKISLLDSFFLGQNSPFKFPFKMRYFL